MADIGNLLSSFSSAFQHGRTINQQIAEARFMQGLRQKQMELEQSQSAFEREKFQYGIDEIARKQKENDRYIKAIAAPEPKTPKPETATGIDVTNSMLARKKWKVERDEAYARLDPEGFMESKMPPTEADIADLENKRASTAKIKAETARTISEPADKNPTNDEFWRGTWESLSQKDPNTLTPLEQKQFGYAQRYMDSIGDKPDKPKERMPASEWDAGALALVYDKNTKKLFNKVRETYEETGSVFLTERPKGWGDGKWNGYRSQMSRLATAIGFARPYQSKYDEDFTDIGSFEEAQKFAGEYSVPADWLEEARKYFGAGNVKGKFARKI
jgi:hypothetical protein